MTAVHLVDRGVRAGESAFACEAAAARWRTARRVRPRPPVTAGAWWSGTVFGRDTPVTLSIDQSSGM